MKRLIIILFCAATLLACKKENEGATGAGGNGGGGSKGEITVTGTVKGDDGTLLKDVVVSDGINCVKTDAQGKFALPADLNKSDHVFVSTPSNYSAPVEKGMATFWKVIKKCPQTGGKYVADFTLNKIANPEKFTIFFFADPQPRRNDGNTDKLAYKSLECCDDMYRDMKEQCTLRSDRPVYGIGLGDIVHQDLTLLDDASVGYKKGMATTGVSTYNIIGNHDQGHTVCDEMQDDKSSKVFESKMGPVNYSFNLGGLHFLMLDNMISPPAGSVDDDGKKKYTDDCITGLTDDIWTFVQNDLAMVSKDTPIMVCAHSPMMRMQSGGERGGDKKYHLPELRSLLKSYSRAYAWAGHSHATFNYAPLSEKIETHTLTRVTGALWTNEYLGSNGTPRGYLVFDYENGSFSWKFHPIPYQSGKHQNASAISGATFYNYRDWDYINGTAMMKPYSDDNKVPLDDNYQMQVFAPGVYENDYVYVNVFMWDEQWDKPKLDGTQMNAVSKTDYKYSIAEWSFTNYYHSKVSSYSTPDKNNCSSMFRGYCSKKSGTVTVTVTDRFGQQFESKLTLK